MEDGKAFGTGPGGELSGLAGGEVFFGAGSGMVFIQERTFNVEMIGTCGQGPDPLNVVGAKDDIADVGDFLTGRNRGDPLG